MIELTNEQLEGMVLQGGGRGVKAKRELDRRNSRVVPEDLSKVTPEDTSETIAGSSETETEPQSKPKPKTRAKRKPRAKKKEIIDE